MDREWNKWGFGKFGSWKALTHSVPHPPISQTDPAVLVKYASFSRNEFAAMGMDLEGSARFTEEYGGGYIGFLEISHKMHVSTLSHAATVIVPTSELTDGQCLNVIRQAYHREYYEKPENKKWATWLNDRPITVKVHISRYPHTLLSWMGYA